MLSPLKIVLLVISSHVLIFLMVYAFENRPTSLYEIYYQEKTNALVKDTSFRNKIVEIDEDGPYKQQINPFKLLDAYPAIPKKLFKQEYNKVHMSIKNEDDYCERVDMYNLMNPANMFENKNFFTDFLNWTIVTEKVIPQIGNVMMDYLTVPTTKEELKKAKYPLDMRINNFYLYKDGFYNYHEIGKNFLCQTQMFNHIPGHKTLVRKDEVFDNVNRYLNFYTDKPQCFNRDMVFPQSFRLYVEEECLQFFELIQTENYFDNLENEPFQYIVKVGHGAKFSHAIFMLDEEVSSVIGAEYDFGNACGNKTDTFIIQKYIKNPLLLDNSNKFDFRVFMFIASTNPMIAYYHDGYLRVSLNPFEQNSTDLATHVTSTYLAEEIIEQAEAEDWTIFGKTAEELKDYHLWDFSALERYLLESEKVHDPYWLENNLRPAIKKALVHIVRATSYTFWRQSNVHELYGIDFMLDDNLNLWFMDSTPNPLLTGVKPELIEEMLLNMFEIQYAYYHSRMKRVLDVIYRLQSKLPEINDEQLRTLQIQYREAVKNRIEPEYELSEGNTWSLFIDQNLLPSSDAYYGHVDDECLHPEIDEVY